MSALHNSQNLEEDIIPPYQPYSYSMTATLLPNTPPPLLRRISGRSSAHSSDIGASAPVFLGKFKGISRSKSPNVLCTSPASPLPSTGSSMADLPGTPTSGSILSGSGSSVYSSTLSSAQWSPGPASPVSPRSRYRKKGGLFKRSFSSTSGSHSPWAKGSKGHRQEEFDPTTVRKNRTLRRKNPQDLYDLYDDLFSDDEEPLDEQDMVQSALHLSETEYDHYSSSDDGYPRPYEMGRLKHAKEDSPRSPPRSVPSPTNSHSNMKSLLPTSPFLFAKWKASSDIDTPPQSKPPSVTDLHQLSVSLYPVYHMLPTPPSPAKASKYLLNQCDNLGEGHHSLAHPEVALASGSSHTGQDFTTSSLPGPPPDHVPPPIPLTSRRLSDRYKRGSVESKKGPEKQEEEEEEEEAEMGKDANGLGIFNVPSDTSNRSTSPSPADPTGPQASPAVPSFSGTATDGSSHQNPRGRVGDVETLANEISAHAATEDVYEKIGVTPQTRIADACDLNNEFALACFTDFTPMTSADPGTIEGVTSPNSNPPIVIDAVEEDAPQFSPTSEKNNVKSVEPEDLGKVADSLDATPLRVFCQFLESSGEHDAFIQRSDRFYALQTQRICTHLRNDHQVAPVKKAKKAEKQSIISSMVIQQREIEDKMLTSMWVMMSFRWMAFGRLLVSPTHELLDTTCGKQSARGDSGLSSGTGGREDRKRVLDLGGIPVGDWGWHCAYDYPKSKVYTVTSGTASTYGTSTAESDNPGQSTKCRGPRNHRHITVSYLWCLPFPDSHFDIVSARSLFMALRVHRGKNCSPAMNLMDTTDEYDLCLEECLRVLKPGGYLEYFLFDNDIVNPGPLAVELSTKFTNELEANAYDPYPTRKWIKRLNKAGYGDMKRAWIFLPMAPQVKPKPPSRDDENEVQSQAQRHHQSGSFDNIGVVEEEVRRKLEAWENFGTMKGSTESVAPITGLAGSWVWERWMLKTSAEAEKDSDWNLSLDTIGSVLDEGRDMKSGWRAMLGWARKPLAADPYTYRRMRADSANSAFSAI